MVIFFSGYVVERGQTFLVVHNVLYDHSVGQISVDLSIKFHYAIMIPLWTAFYMNLNKQLLTYNFTFLNSKVTDSKMINLCYIVVESTSDWSKK